MIRTKALLIVFVVVVVWLTIDPRGASAEWFADLYLGPVFTQEGDVTFTAPGDVEEMNDVEFDTSFAFGGRGGYWLEMPFTNANLNFGLALDVSHFRPDIGTQVVSGTDNGVPDVFTLSDIDLALTPISFDLMLRWPLMTSGQFPKGQLQPYFTLGPTIFIADAEDTINFDPPGQSEGDTSVGLKFSVGAAWYFLENVAAFGEYRFMHASPEFEFNDGGVPTTVEMDVNTHHFVAGISYRF